MSRPAHENAKAAQLAKDEVRFLEAQIVGLPTAKSEAQSSDADGLLKFSYHQNPYVRTLTKVLWSGYAISRGQLVEGSQRFSQARRDAQVSAVDAATQKALDDAAAALEAAMSPSGSLAGFLTELRDRTNQRLWARVCETAGLPPPSFATRAAPPRRAVKADELDAEEEAEIAALRLKPLEPKAVVPAEEDDDDEDDDGEDGDDQDGGGDDAGDQTPTALNLKVTRTGNIEQLAELLLAAAADLLRDARARSASGALTLTLGLEVQGKAGGGGNGGGKRRRRRRR